jgi:hypothetical protein
VAFSIAFKAGIGVTAAAAVIAAGPMVSSALGLSGDAEPSNFSASWEADQATNATNASASNDAVLRRVAQDKAEAKARAEAKAEAKAKAKAKAEARRKAEEKAARAKRRAAISQGGTPAQNKALGMQMCGDAGWSASQCADLAKLWDRESGWNHKAANGSSGAFGIPQSLPGSKMASAGSDWRTNPRTQIKWGLSYIKDVYGNPSNAWGHSQSVGWY